MGNWTTIADTLKNTGRVLEEGPAYNLQRLQDPNARVVRASLGTDNIGSKGLLRTTFRMDRPTNPLRERVYMSQVTELENRNTYTEFMDVMQTVIGGGGSSQSSRLVSVIDDFFKQAKILESNSGAAMRAAFVGKAENVATVLTQATDSITELRLEADTRLRDSVTSLNSTINALYALNQNILSAQTPLKLYDKRDELTRELAKAFDIKVSYGVGGVAKVQSKSSGEMLVSGDSFAQFSYEGILTKTDILDHADYPPLKMHHYNQDQKQTNTSIFTDFKSSFSLFKGGKWEALIKLRDEILPEAWCCVDTLAQNFSGKINILHNDGSSCPAQGYFKSSGEHRGADGLDGLGAFSIYAVDQNGNQLRGGAGLLNQVNIDPATILSSVEGKAPTMADLIRELNEKLDLAPSRDRAAMGAILDDAGVQIDGQYLLNNVQLLARSQVSGVAPADSVTFELDLQGSSHFGSNIEILGVKTNDVGGGNDLALAQNQLPSSFRLEKDTNAASGQFFTLQNSGAGREVTLEIRVIGDNGVVSRGEVSFVVNPAITPGARVATNNVVAGDFAHPIGTNLSSHSGVARAKLVDSNGAEIDPLSGGSGKLVIDTNNSSYRLVIQGGGFGGKFGFNDLFHYDAHTGFMEVNSDISANVGNLAVGRIQKDNGSDSGRMVGDVAASAPMLFGGGAIAAGDVVSVNGIDFTFRNAPLPVPADPRDVDVAGTPLLNLVNRINAHPALQNLVQATLNVNTITVTAKAAGTGGNAIAVGTNLVGGATASINGFAPAPGLVISTLIGGTDKITINQEFRYDMDDNNLQILEAISNLQGQAIHVDCQGIVPESFVSLSNLATMVTGFFSNYVNDAEKKSDIAVTVLKQTDSAIKGSFGISREEEYIRSVDLAQYMNMLSHILGQMQQIEKTILDNIK
ncbi:MAG: hypothetical protein COA94_05290 [Rickettsiales bacterium]|nr:MAG: hypothetical protein COA94_05290 [Rickettsiales bacterium]